MKFLSDPNKKALHESITTCSLWARRICARMNMDDIFSQSGDIFGGAFGAVVRL